MPETIFGLPLHPLVVHAVVVLLPLAAIGVAAIALSERLRQRFGPLVVILAALATAAVPVATSTGEGLAARVGEPHQHAELGETLIAFAVPLLLLAAWLVWAGRLSGRIGDRLLRSRTLRVATVAVAIAVAAGTVVQVYRVGESGARAVWGTSTTSTGSPPNAPR